MLDDDEYYQGPFDDDEYYQGPFDDDAERQAQGKMNTVYVVKHQVYGVSTNVVSVCATNEGALAEAERRAERAASAEMLKKPIRCIAHNCFELGDHIWFVEPMELKS